MNLVGWIVLAALVADYVLGLVATALNLRALEPTLPSSFSKYYDEHEYERSQAYTRAKSRLGFVSDTAGLAVLLAFWFMGGFELADRLARDLGLGEVATGVVYILGLAILQSLLSVPFDVYRTFVLEARFGFNRTAPSTFVADRAKGLALVVAIGGPVFALLLALFTYFGPLAWLYCWIAVVTVMLVMQYLAPTLIMPLFNQFEPLEEGALKSAIMDYAQRVRFPLSNVFVIDGSRRSTKSNAFFTGFGRTKRVALFDTLVEKHTAEEIVAIVAHEVGHHKKGHIVQGTVVNAMHMGLMLFLLSLVLSSPALYEAFKVTTPSVYIGFVLFGLLYSPVEMALSVTLNALSRRNEYQADAFAAKTTGDPHSMRVALMKLTTENLANLTPHPFYVKMYYSHPPVRQRIAALLEEANK
jgi:STE24 endopeptidase